MTIKRKLENKRSYLSKQTVRILSIEQALLFEQITVELEQVWCVLILDTHQATNSPHQIALPLQHGPRVAEYVRSEQALRVVLGLEVALKGVHVADQRLGLVLHSVALLGILEEVVYVGVENLGLHALHGLRVPEHRAHVILELLHVPLGLLERVVGHDAARPTANARVEASACQVCGAHVREACARGVGRHGQRVLDLFQTRVVLVHELVVHVRGRRRGTLLLEKCAHKQMLATSRVHPQQVYLITRVHIGCLHSVCCWCYFHAELML